MFGLELATLALLFCLGGPINVAACWILRFQTRPCKKRPIVTPQAGYFLQLQRHLNLSDLLIVFAHLPGEVLRIVLQPEWVGGEFLCKTSKFFSALAFHLSSNIVVCIAIDRAVVVYQLSRLTARRGSHACSGHQTLVRRMLGVAWTVALALSALQLVAFQTVEKEQITVDGVNRTTLTKCTTYWNAKRLQLKLRNATFPYDNLESVYYLQHMLTVFWLPATITIFSYMFVIVGLFWLNPRRNASMVGASKVHGKAFRTCSLLVLAYLLCWTPYNIVAATQLNVWGAFFLRHLVICNSVINPFIYYQATGAQKDCDESAFHGKKPQIPLAIRSSRPKIIAEREASPETAETTVLNNSRDNLKNSSGEAEYFQGGESQNNLV